MDGAPVAGAGPVAAELVAAAGLGGAVGYAVADARSGQVLEAMAPQDALRPASTAKVVTALERALALPQGLLADERAVLEEYGNMSAPTVFFVLERALATGLPKRTLMTALGPGFSAATATLLAAWVDIVPSPVMSVMRIVADAANAAAPLPLR